MKINHLAKEKSILNKFLAEIRNVHVQKDSMRFRRNIERIGEILGYELSKNLSFENKVIETPLGIKDTELPVNDVILCSILRAGLPLHNGLLNYFDDAENAFISAYRHHPNNDEEFEIVVEYFASPSIDGKTLLLVDPMLATGRSLVAVYDAIKKYGTPKEIKIVSVIGSTEGVEYITKFFPENTDLWIADIDNKLSDKGYIVPGLGDAGDLAFGTKM
ncbi:uracil phosphoribosyltransferase [Tenacibaculum sp. Bg11-29]|uniref:uracil phosphoribosyltransferase n=1 Tax=Tenacibaculum sp. Bg11-29 TaxID=2058306 RepID=UPI000C3202BC|nr:uracil phosphoribosyltransferase [Tenacibaculum sp. Bg11-29]PKH49786.1 uracil phosphoribosyltransferase [Tenacibaculum sp. Bg11-29]